MKKRKTTSSRKKKIVFGEIITEIFSMKLFTSGFLQVFFVAMNTFFIHKEFYIGVFVCSFLISWLWSMNVKKIAFGNNKDRFIYASGAAVGSIFGLIVASCVKN